MADPEYIDGLRVAVSAALDYGFASVGKGAHSAPSIPIALRAQARLAARSGISLETVLRRYFAGYALLSDFVIEEAERGDLIAGAELKALRHTQSTLLDRVVAAISDEYNRESRDWFESAEERRAELVKRLLVGETVDAGDLAYNLDAHHLAMIVSGPGGEGVVKRLTEGLDHRLLLIRRAEVLWIWIGTRRAFEPAWLEGLSSEGLPANVFVAFGEPGKAFHGWSMSHRQAIAAQRVARRRGGSPVRYADVALVASIAEDDLLATSLQELYLAPLSEERDGGRALRETLRAFFCAEGNVSSAAAALGVKRHTVTNRLRTIEDQLGRPLGECATEIDVALRLEELDSPTLPYDTTIQGGSSC